MSHPGIHALERPDAPALIRASDGEVITWRQLHSRAVAAANCLIELGLHQGSMLAICVENRFEFVVFVWASQYAGFRYTPISTRLGPSEIAYIVSDCEAEVLVVSDQTIDSVGPAASEGGAPVLLNVDRLDLFGDELEVTPLYERAEGVPMLYSSGTTGRPKGVWNSAPPEPIEEMPQRIAFIGRLYQIDYESVYLSPAPLYHSAPLSFLLWLGRLGGATVIMEKFDAAEALALIAQHRVTHSQWVPTMFVRLLRLSAQERRAHDLSSHQFAIHGAAPCPVGVKEAMIDWWGPVIHEYYAGTEGAGTCMIGPEDWITHKGSVGKAVGGVIHIMSEDGRDQPRGEVGEIWFEGDASFEYYKDAERTASVRRQGRATFGDLGYLDEDGFLYLTDRKAFTINVGGVNVYPREAEDALIMHPLVADVAVFGIPHPEYGEEVKGVVELLPGTAVYPGLDSELVEFCRSRLSGVKSPRSIDFEESLPRHPNGKLYKQSLRDRYSEVVK